ncbi:MAG: hypothetical protein IPK13_10535 [Deltaproteobacteria bacterium]|nr:hypothetical protein [Deltaproteobacteria bacterium]
MDRWALDDGRVADAARDSASAEVEPARPERRFLPPGYQAQPAWGFRTPAGHYTFNRAYRPGEPRPGSVAIMVGQLDPELSYWVVISPRSSEAAGESDQDRAINFAQARQALGRRLTFERFSSPLLTDDVRMLLSTASPNLGLVASAPGTAGAGVTEARDRFDGPGRRLHKVPGGSTR